MTLEETCYNKKSLELGGNDAGIDFLSRVAAQNRIIMKEEVTKGYSRIEKCSHQKNEKDLADVHPERILNVVAPVNPNMVFFLSVRHQI